MVVLQSLRDLVQVLALDPGEDLVESGTVIYEGQDGSVLGVEELLPEEEGVGLRRQKQLFLASGGRVDVVEVFIASRREHSI